MITIESFFNGIFCINLDRRPDRWVQAVAELAKHGIGGCQRFTAFDGKNADGTPNGNAGCTRSHRMLLKAIAAGPLESVLVLEDDFMIHVDDFAAKFDMVAGAVPSDWDMLYLGGHYGSRPLARINSHVVKINTMLTTSSYGITRRFARVLSDQIESTARDKRNCADQDPLDVYLGPVDSVFSSHLPHHNCFIVQPRLMIQRPGLSDLTHREENYLFCMTDRNHENMV